MAVWNLLGHAAVSATAGKLRSHIELPVRLPAGPRDAQDDQLFRTTASAVVTAIAPGTVAVTGDDLPTVIVRWG
jgi:hypothetical protein